MLDLILLIIFVISFFIGLRRGFILQLIHMTGFIIAFVVAYLYHDELAPKLTLWIPYPALNEESTLSMIFDATNMDQAYYRAIAFAIIFFVVKIITQIIGSMLDFLAQFPLLKQFNSGAGAVLGFIEMYLIVFILLYIAALLPVGFVQTAISDSVMAENMIKHTPILSDQLKEWWFEYVLAS
ncbi:CvpA family protein [Bacillus sp. 2205SS5-2]|uniref:CvpA family protein n=1 Tax=Bacillus sp. 2205SS5-2 TaxID=3109031 RepID=UPI003005E58A